MLALPEDLDFLWNEPTALFLLRYLLHSIWSTM
jgi:hypothetical protein